MSYLQIIFLLQLLIAVNAELSEGEELFLKLYVQIERLQKSVDMLNLKVEMMEKFYRPTAMNPSPSYEEKQKNRLRSMPIFDARIDPLPNHCQTSELPSNCAKATECTQTSGYYNITVSRYRNHTFPAFCDYRTEGGDWLHILQRIDGSENFNRPWADYVQGFGEVDGEYWIGLENLYALTNYDGAQELFVYMENFRGQSKFARYDHFKVAGAAENYKLKSLGKYTGTAGNSLEYSRGAEFRTYDDDRQTPLTTNCARIHKGGWWYKACTRASPTGFYHMGDYKGDDPDGIFWRDWQEFWISMKFFVMMIRRQRIFLN